MTTYRERREARAERLRGWADKREAAAAAVFQANRPITSDWAFITQPGHIPARARIIAQEDRQYESLRKAESMKGRADGIEAQLAGAIYSDDENAVEALQERIAGLEAERDRIKAYNATCRKGARDLSILTDAEKRSLLGVLKFAPYQSKGGAFPSYHLSNLSANINRNRKRLEELRRASAK